MKKLLTLAFLLSFGVTFVGCGGDAAAPKKTETPPVSKGESTAPEGKTDMPKDEPPADAAATGDKDPAAEGAKKEE